MRGSMTTDGKFTGEGLIFQPIRFKGFTHPPFGIIFDDYDMVDGYFGLYRIFQHAAGGTILSGLKRYLLATPARVVVPRVTGKPSLEAPAACDAMRRDAPRDTVALIKYIISKFP